MQMQIAEYTQTAAALAILNEKYRGQLFDVTTTKGMDEAKKARAEVKGYRIALEKVRKEIKAPALERSRLIDEEAKRITAELLAIEEPIDQQIKEEERRKEEEKAAKAKAEAARLASIYAKISAIRNRVVEVANQPAVVIGSAVGQALALELNPEDFQELLPDAVRALHETQIALGAALDARMIYEAEQAHIKDEQEAEAARIKAEREAMERQRAELEAQQRKLEEAEQARLQAEAAKVVKPIRKGKANDPLADIKQTLNANTQTAKALDEAYQRGFQAGLNSARQAA